MLVQVVAVRRETGQLLPFQVGCGVAAAELVATLSTLPTRFVFRLQVLSTRKRRKVQVEDITVQVVVKVSDE